MESQPQNPEFSLKILNSGTILKTFTHALCVLNNFESGQMEKMLCKEFFFQLFFYF